MYVCEFVGEMLHTVFQDYGGAVECFQRVLQFEPEHADAMYRVGALLLAESNDVDGAEQMFRRALEV